MFCISDRMHKTKSFIRRMRKHLTDNLQSEVSVSSKKQCRYVHYLLITSVLLSYVHIALCPQDVFDLSIIVNSGSSMSILNLVEYFP